jgi:hypothetical protein
MEMIMNTEQLFIGKDDSILHVQEKFENIFPNLCLSIFEHCSEGKRPSRQDILISDQARMGDLNPLLEEAVLVINPEMTVSEFETLSFDKFGLFVQVSRKYNDRETDKFLNDQSLLGEANLEKRIEPSPNETIYFRDVPFGC